MSASTPCFTVSANCHGRARSETRNHPSSAMVLADRWANEGCQGIRLTSPGGVDRDRTSFRGVLRRALDTGLKPSFR